LERLVQVEPADARLDDRGGELLVDLEHAVHPPEVDDDRAADARRGAAVAVVPAHAGHPQRQPALVGDADDRLDLLDRLRLDDRGGVVVVPALEPERVAELAQVLLGREHVLRADDPGELLQRGRERPLRELGRQRDGHAITSWRSAPAGGGWRRRPYGRSGSLSTREPTRARPAKVSNADGRATAPGRSRRSSPRKPPVVATVVKRRQSVARGRDDVRRRRYCARR